MKRLLAIPAICLALFLFSCNNEPAKEEAKAADTTAAVAAEPVVTKPAFSPFKVVVIQHKVKNFDKAATGYFNSDSLRNTFGITHFAVGRLVKDSNTVFVMDKIEDVEKSKAYFALPAVKAGMTKAGVSMAPGYTYAEIIRNNDAPATSALNLAIVHHVKDFDAWLKAFDAEGPASRAANGLIDRAIARDLNDPNTVSVMFEVTDEAKAKARVASPELKKIMTDAGVDSPPTIRWYKMVN